MKNRGHDGCRGNFRELVSLSLDLRWEKYEKELRRCQKTCSEAAVHDVRVATRRLISSLDIAAAVLRDESLTEIRQTLRRRFREFGPLRDLQVQLMRAEKLRDRFPEIEPFYTLLLLRERRMIRSIGKTIGRVRTGKTKYQIRVLREKLRTLLANPSLNRAGLTAAVGVLAARFARTSGLLAGAEASEPDSIHRVRISFKKYRYAAEALEGALPWITTGMLKAMNQYQDAMGAIQDVEVFSQALKDYQKRTRGRERITFLPLLQDLAQEHQRLIGEFMEVSDGLSGFWKEGDPSPDRFVKAAG